METVMRKLKTFYCWLKNKLLHLNLFDSDRCRSDAFYQRTAIISTRIYIVLLTLIVTILVLSSAFGDRTERITIRKPSQTTYEDLRNKYMTTLSCRCKQTAIPFRAFMSMSVQYHPICSSVFVSDLWISLLFSPNIGYYFQLDFRSLASGHFQLLSSLCLLTKRTVNDALDEFLSSTLLSVNVRSSKSLKVQSEVRSMLVRTLSTNAVRRLVRLMINSTHNNNLQPALQTTGVKYLYTYPDGQLASGFRDGCFLWVDGERCCCSTYQCLSPSSFYDLFANDTYGIYISPNSPIANISGVTTGCYAIEALLQSTLECLFDQVCLNTLLTFLPITNISAIDILRINQTKFPPTTRIEVLLRELFIEQWTTTNSFSAYYKHCAPVACTYTFVTRNSIIYALTVLIGLEGGLTVILRFCVLHAIHWWRSRANQLSRTNARVPFSERFQATWRRTKVKINQLNVYRIDATNTDPYDLTTAIISTRIYVLLLTLSITILIVFTSLQVHIYGATVESPSREVFEHLHNNYSSTLQCPCSQIAINYGSFVSVSPRYHPVCSSPYISLAWILSIVGTINHNFSYSHSDFHMVGQTFFSIVSVLCSTARSTLSDAWLTFNYSTFISEHVTAQRELIIRTNATLDQFESDTIDEFKRLFSLIRLQTKTMLTTRHTNVDLYTRQLIDDNIQIYTGERDQMTSYPSSHYLLVISGSPFQTLCCRLTPLQTRGERIDFHSVSLRYDDCLCELTDDCREQVWMYSNGIHDEYERKFPIPNFFIGCFTLQSVLQSSLECFFNQTCLDAVQNEVTSNRSINISILELKNTRFSPETLIGTLMDSLMIENWDRIIDYDRYYDHCAPKLCSYTVFYRMNAVYVLTKLISFIGGLTVGLKIVVSIIVKEIRKRMRPIIDNNYFIARRTMKDRIRARCLRIKMKAWQLNIFTREVTMDVLRQYVGIVATRLYIILISLSIIILVIYASMEKYTQHATVSKPSQTKFAHLQSNPRYVSTLECPCHHISIPYGTFISVTPHFHQLCSSDFAVESLRWMSIIYNPTASLRYPYSDFRIFGVPEFQALFALCTLANKTLTDALAIFMSNIFVSAQVQSRETIEQHANESLSRFRSSTPRTFVRMLDYVRQITQGNGIVSSILSNWHFLSLNTTEHGHSLWGEPRSYNDGNCSCGINATCTSPAFINEWRVPGFLVGCYPLEALLQSTLECLYDVVCINRLKSMYYTINITIRPLDPRLSTPYTTVQSLVNELMIDRWNTSVMYERYYAACNPLSCSYSITERANVLYIISTTVGLFGGLSVVLKLIISAMVSIVQQFIIRRQRRIEPNVSVISSSE